MAPSEEGLYYKEAGSLIYCRQCRIHRSIAKLLADDYDLYPALMPLLSGNEVITAYSAVTAAAVAYLTVSLGE